MKIKNVDAAGSKLAIQGLVLVVDKDGVVEIDDMATCKALMGMGWTALVGAKKVEVPVEESPKVAHLISNVADPEEAPKVARAKEVLRSVSAKQKSKPKYKRGE